jgi:hypothetical protein
MLGVPALPAILESFDLEPATPWLITSSHAPISTKATDGTMILPTIRSWLSETIAAAGPDRPASACCSGSG